MQQSSFRDEPKEPQTGPGVEWPAEEVVPSIRKAKVLGLISGADPYFPNINGEKQLASCLHQSCHVVLDKVG